MRLKKMVYIMVASLIVGATFITSKDVKADDEIKKDMTYGNYIMEIPSQLGASGSIKKTGYTSLGQVKIKRARTGFDDAGTFTVDIASSISGGLDENYFYLFNSSQKKLPIKIVVGDSESETMTNVSKLEFKTKEYNQEDEFNHNVAGINENGDFFNITHTDDFESYKNIGVYLNSNDCKNKSGVFTNTFVWTVSYDEGIKD